MTKNLLITLLIIFATPLWGQKTNTPKETQIEVILGIDKVIKLDFTPSTKVQVGNSAILDYQIIPQKREITLKGIKPQRTSVTLRNTAGDIKARYLVTVTANDQSKVVQELREFLGDIEGLEIGIKGNKVVVEGKIVVPNDIGRVVVVLDQYKDVLRLVELSPHTHRSIAKKMEDAIQKNGMKDVTVQYINGQYWLEGVVTAQSEFQKAQTIAQSYIPDNIQSLARQTEAVETIKKRGILLNLISINAKKQPQPIPKMVKITAQFVELIKDYEKVFGFKWTPLLAGDGGSIAFGKTTTGGVTTKSNGTLSGVISNLFPRLASAKSAGQARVIQSGVIITKNNIQASVVKKTEKPFALGTGDFTKAEKAEAGFDLKITPQILPGEKIDLKIGLRVSASVGDPPETVSNNLSTALVVKSKESAVVGGVVVKRTATDYDRNPPGGRTQAEDDGAAPLFSFVKSKSYFNTKSQFVVFVTPEIIESASEGTSEVKRKFRKRRR